MNVNVNNWIPFVISTVNDWQDFQRRDISIVNNRWKLISVMRNGASLNGEFNISRDGSFDGWEIGFSVQLSILATARRNATDKIISFGSSPRARERFCLSKSRVGRNFQREKSALYAPAGERRPTASLAISTLPLTCTLSITYIEWSDNERY